MAKARIIAGAALTALLVTVGVVACSGGGGGGDSPADPGGGPPPPPPPPPACALGSNANITISVVPSRTTGVAPLAVFFNAIQTTATTTTRPFHELDYQWNFGDAAGPTWGFGSRAATSLKNRATGPVAAHLFENPGTYNVCLTVSDGTNTADGQITITVTDPNVVFAATTLCVQRTPGGSATGCPAGATVITSNDFDNVINATAANGSTHKRILFECDGTFTASTTAVISASGPGMVGAYPVGCPARAKPIIAGNPATGKLGLGASNSPTFGDWRIMDLQFSGSAGLGDAIGHRGTSDGVTIFRNRIDAADHAVVADINVLEAINTPTQTHALYNALALVENDISNSQQYGFIGAASRFMALGNRITNSIQQHGMRTQYTQLSVVSNNEFGPAAATSLTMRGLHHFIAARTAAGFPGVRTLPDAIYTEFGVVSDNRFIGGSNAIPFTLKSIQNVEDTRFRFHIVERNWFTLGASGLQAFETESSELTVRNNLFDTTTAAGGQIAIHLSKTTNTPAPADAVFVYNNSHFSNKTSATDAFVTLNAFEASSPTNVKVKNNLGYAPNNTAASTNSARGPFGGGVETSNNSTTAQIQNTNPFGVAAPGLPGEWRPASGSYAVDGGTPVRVFSDFFGAARTGTYDIGAVNP